MTGEDSAHRGDVEAGTTRESAAVAGRLAQRLPVIPDQQRHHDRADNDQRHGLDPPEQDAEKGDDAGDADDAGDKIGHLFLALARPAPDFVALRPRPSVLTSQLAVRKRRASLPRRPTSW